MGKKPNFKFKMKTHKRETRISKAPKAIKKRKNLIFKKLEMKTNTRATYNCKRKLLTPHLN